MKVTMKKNLNQSSKKENRLQLKKNQVNRIKMPKHSQMMILTMMKKNMMKIKLKIAVMMKMIEVLWKMRNLMKAEIQLSTISMTIH